MRAVYWSQDSGFWKTNIECLLSVHGKMNQEVTLEQNACYISTSKDLGGADRSRQCNDLQPETTSKSNDTEATNRVSQPYVTTWAITISVAVIFLVIVTVISTGFVSLQKFYEQADQFENGIGDSEAV